MSDVPSSRFSQELMHLQVPLMLTLVARNEAQRDAARIVLRVIDFLADSDAPEELMRDLIRVATKWVSE